jgi:drug/metabolite transporter (DMT)-like permease
VIVRPRDTPLAFAALALAGTIWGASFVLGKIALTELSVPHLLLYRFAFASLAFLVLLFRMKIRLNRNEWGIVGVAAVLGVPIQFLMQFEGLARTTASHAALMIGTAPAMVAIAGYFAFRERLRPAAWFALVASTAGVALIVMQATGGTGRDHPSLSGDLLVIASLVAAVVWILASKRLMERHSPVAVSGVITLTGSVMLAVWVLARNGMPPTQLHAGTWLAVISLGVVATTCSTALWNWGLAHTDAGRAGAFINLEPVIGAILGVLVLRESLGPMAVAGGALIVGGALVVSRKEVHA